MRTAVLCVGLVCWLSLTSPAHMQHPAFLPLALTLIGLAAFWGWLNQIEGRWAGARLSTISLGVVALRPFITLDDPSDSVEFGLDANPYLESAGWLFCIGSLAFVTGFSIVRRRQPSSASGEQKGADSDLLYRLLLIHGFVATGLLVVVLVASGDPAGVLLGRTEQLREVNERLSTYFVMAPISVAGTGLLTYVHYYPKKTAKFGLVAAGLSTLPYLLSGGRSLVLIPILAAWLAVDGRRENSLDAKRKTRLLAGVLLVLSLFSAMRDSRSDGVPNPGLVASYLVQPQVSVESLLSSDDTSQFRYFAILVGTVPDEVGFRGGATYASIPARPVPSSIWKHKPVAADVELNDLLVPEARARGFAGFSFSYFGEPYYNFGKAGVVAFSALLGAVVAAMDRLRTSALRSGSAKYETLAILTIAHLPIFVRGSLSADLFRLMVVSIPVVCVWSLLHRRRARSKTPRTRAALSAA